MPVILLHKLYRNHLELMSSDKKAEQGRIRLFCWKPLKSRIDFGRSSSDLLKETLPQVMDLPVGA